MAHTMRQANLLDVLNIVATRRKQRVLRLNPPYTLVQPEALLSDLLQPGVPMKPPANFVYVYSERGVVQGYVQARCRWQRHDEWTITTLAALDKAPDHVWERLIEEVCRRAGEQGVTRVFVKVSKDEPQLNTFRSLAFTPYTNEEIWGRLYFSQNSSEEKDDPYRKLLRRRTGRDAWDLMQLYSAVTPPVVQRAEMLTTRQWHVSQIPRPWFMSQGLLENSYVWQDESLKSEGLGGYVRLLTGVRGHWITTLFRPDPGNRQMVPVALDHVLWKAARHGNKPVYCGLREYQAEAGTVLEERGFHLLSEQALLVKYIAEPIKERQPALVPFLVKNEQLIPTK
jgi:N-acetylglutamate synthase-like GNAT family acetyltransferase